jgi:hypothetical protein
LVPKRSSVRQYHWHDCELSEITWPHACFCIEAVIKPSIKHRSDESCVIASIHWSARILLWWRRVRYKLLYMTVAMNGHELIISSAFDVSNHCQQPCNYDDIPWGNRSCLFRKPNASGKVLHIILLYRLRTTTNDKPVHKRYTNFI